MNVNQLAKKLCEFEGKKKQTDVAQMKESLRCLRDVFRITPQDQLSPIMKYFGLSGFVMVERKEIKTTKLKRKK